MNIFKKLIPLPLKKIAHKIRFNLRVSRSLEKRIDASLNENVLNCFVAFNKFGGYCVPLSAVHERVVKLILEGQVYEPDTIDFMLKNCKGGDIVHAGTFFGDFLPALSAGVESNAKIWAFEPTKEFYKCAEITIQINSISNIELLNMGLGESSTEVKMEVVNKKGVTRGGTSKIVGEQDSGGEYIQVNVDSIDNLIPKDRNISIIQLDVEGYEKQALMGAIETITRCKPILILEDNERIIESEWFYNKITALNYKIVGEIHGNTIFKIA